MNVQKAAVFAGASVAALVFVTGCSGGIDASDVSASSTAAGPTPSETSSPSVVSGSDIQGVWKGDADQLLNANTANLGGPGGITCSGPIRLTFKADGGFKQAGTATCGVGGRNVTASISSVGTYTTEDDRLTISDTRNNGTLDIPGAAMPFPGGWSNGSATYQINGDTLVIDFADPSVGNVTQEYVRER